MPCCQVEFLSYGDMFSQHTHFAHIEYFLCFRKAPLPVDFNTHLLLSLDLFTVYHISLPRLCKQSVCQFSFHCFSWVWTHCFIAKVHITYILVLLKFAKYHYSYLSIHPIKIDRVLLIEIGNVHIL